MTIDVGELSESETASALDLGTAYAQRILERGLIYGAALQLNGDVRFVTSEGSQQLL